jgi:hypothetical protein
MTSPSECMACLPVWVFWSLLALVAVFIYGSLRLAWLLLKYGWGP